MVAYFLAAESVIGAAPAHCYELVLAVRRYGEWWQGMRVAPLGSEGILRAGSRARCAAAGLEWVLEIERLDPYRAVELRYIQGDLLGPARWQFDAQPAGTRVCHLLRGVQSSGAAARSPEVDANAPHLLMQSLHSDAFPG